MSVDASELAAMLGDSIDRYAGQAYGFEQRAAWLCAAERHSTAAWKDYAEFGWLALRLPENHGGFDADVATLGVVMERVGAHLLLEPLLASAVLGSGLALRAASPAQKSAWCPALADGTLRLALAHEDASGERLCTLDSGGRVSGAKTSVLHGDVADRIVLSCLRPDGRAALCIVDRDAPGLHRRDYSLVDGRGACHLELEAAAAEVLDGSDDPAAVIEDTLDEASIALCAEAVGVIRSLVNKTAQYLAVRKQFGRPIGSNQALQHRLTELYLLQQESVALAGFAAEAFIERSDTRTRTVSGARAYIARALRHVANEAVQMHGGIGITDELDISHYFRRAMVINGLFGGYDLHFQRFVDAAESGQ